MNHMMDVLFYLILISTLINFNCFGINAQNSSINNISCNTVNDCLDTNRLCLNNQRKFGPNYKWNTTSLKFEYFECYENIECQEFDKNLFCYMSLDVSVGLDIHRMKLQIYVENKIRL